MLTLFGRSIVSEDFFPYRKARSHALILSFCLSFNMNCSQVCGNTCKQCRNVCVAPYSGISSHLSTWFTFVCELCVCMCALFPSFQHSDFSSHVFSIHSKVSLKCLDGSDIRTVLLTVFVSVTPCRLCRSNLISP